MSLPYHASKQTTQWQNRTHVQCFNIVGWETRSASDISTDPAQLSSTETNYRCCNCQLLITCSHSRLGRVFTRDDIVYTAMPNVQWVSELEFNIPFQHKHGYIRDETNVQCHGSQSNLKPGHKCTNRTWYTLNLSTEGRYIMSPAGTNKTSCIWTIMQRQTYHQSPLIAPTALDVRCIQCTDATCSVHIHCGIEQRAPPIFGRMATMLGIGHTF